MEFRHTDEINKFFNQEGIFLIRKDDGHQFVRKTGENPNSFIDFNQEEESKIANFIISNTINPFISFKNNNVRQYATRINLDVINDFLREQETIDKLQALHDKLMDRKYISINGVCYQLKYNGERGLWLIDKGLIPITDLTEINENINVVKEALAFDDPTNQFKPLYDLEIKKFNQVAISNFEK